MHIFCLQICLIVAFLRFLLFLLRLRLLLTFFLPNLNHVGKLYTLILVVPFVLSFIVIKSLAAPRRSRPFGKFRLIQKDQFLVTFHRCSLNSMTITYLMMFVSRTSYVPFIFPLLLILPVLNNFVYKIQLE